MGQAPYGCSGSGAHAISEAEHNEQGHGISLASRPTDTPLTSPDSPTRPNHGHSDHGSPKRGRKQKIPWLQQPRYQLGKLVGWCRLRRVPVHIRHISGPADPDLRPEDMVVLTLVRDGEAHVEAFLRHHFALGVRHVVLLDNGSTDDTLAIARRFGHVTILRTLLPYKHYKYVLKRYLVDRFGRDCWSLSLDIDELFDFPGSQQVTLVQLIDYLEAHQFSGLVAQMLDLFPRGPVATWPSGTALTAHSKWYDLSGLATADYFPFDNLPSNPNIRFHFGGIRGSAFGVNVFLTKHPLLNRKRGARPSTTSSHYCHGARVADFSGLIRHYKFERGFVEKSRQAVARNNYAMSSKEPKAYLKRLSEDPALELTGESSSELESLDQLVAEGFLVVSDSYRAYVERIGQS